EAPDSAAVFLRGLALGPVSWLPWRRLLMGVVSGTRCSPGDVSLAQAEGLPREDPPALTPPPSGLTLATSLNTSPCRPHPGYHPQHLHPPASPWLPPSTPPPSGLTLATSLNPSTLRPHSGYQPPALTPLPSGLILATSLNTSTLRPHP
ncbi:hypothetical protein NHX12_001346, partial [Muraenolepis orangiensis]